MLAEEEFETDELDQSSREFLEDAIQDYNAMFGTSFDTSADKFQNYYKDLSQRLRNRELDLAIVVNMFLTGFDATTLNTLWVDKNLRQHGLIQAYSRTNRILNSVKTYGNIVSFRDLEQATNDALALFGNKDARGIVLLKPYADYHAEYEAKVAELLLLYPLGTPIVGEAAPEDVHRPVRGDPAAAEHPDCIRRLRRQRDPHRTRVPGLPEHLPRPVRRVPANRRAEREAINDDVVFEIELIKQIEVNVDYILMLLQKHLDEHGAGQDKEIRAAISRAIDSSPTLRNKKDLIEQFVDSLNVDADVDESWRAYIEAKRVEELDRIIVEENLKPAETRTFVDNAFRDGAIPSTGTAVTKILPPVSRFSAGNAHALKKQTVLDKLTGFFDRFFGLT